MLHGWVDFNPTSGQQRARRSTNLGGENMHVMREQQKNALNEPSSILVSTFSPPTTFCNDMMNRYSRVEFGHDILAYDTASGSSQTDISNLITSECQYESAHMSDATRAHHFNVEDCQCLCSECDRGGH